MSYFVGPSFLMVNTYVHVLHSLCYIYHVCYIANLHIILQRFCVNDYITVSIRYIFLNDEMFDLKRYFFDNFSTYILKDGVPAPVVCADKRK